MIANPVLLHINPGLTSDGIISIQYTVSIHHLHMCYIHTTKHRVHLLHLPCRPFIIPPTASPTGSSDSQANRLSASHHLLTLSGGTPTLTISDENATFAAHGAVSYPTVSPPGFADLPDVSSLQAKVESILSLPPVLISSIHSGPSHGSTRWHCTLNHAMVCITI